MIHQNDIKKGAARFILCSALAISIALLPIPAHAEENTDPMLTTGFEDDENVRLFRYRTLKALNTLRDMGLTPQAIVETLGRNDKVTAATDQAASALSGYTSDVGQEIAGAVQDKTNEVVQDVADAATEAAKRQMNNWVDSIGESIGQAIREFVDGLFGVTSTGDAGQEG